jgi:hypothetical protein
MNVTLKSSFYDSHKSRKSSITLDSAVSGIKISYEEDDIVNAMK